MANDSEKTCPLCAEEMDLTDQQLKPCKCDYQICVWCWHHIMDMAEKDEAEGRCPACRTPYNKEKIVGMGANCERLVSEMNMEKKLKSQKGKSKTSEGRKQLSSVRVIQRNLVYIVGLPINLADEDLLQQKEYFGQYGKVLKVSMSRTAAGAIQHFANSTCSVYITYSNEEEAVRCIQSVHGFVLEGRSLRACFGTTKYCHAWLRNMPCSNPDCLYLHEIGSQEDSFSKDEILSAYTRVQQITDATNSMQRRSGSTLPPPANEYCNNSSAPLAKPVSKTAASTNNSVSSARSSPPNSRSTSLPAGALWGIRASNSQPTPTSISSSNGTLKQKSDGCSGPLTFSTSVAVPNQVSSLQNDTGKKLVHSIESNTAQPKCNLEAVEPVKKELKSDSRILASDSFSTSALPATSPLNKQLHVQPTSKDKGKIAGNSPNITNLFDQSMESGEPFLNKESVDTTEGIIESSRSDKMSESSARQQVLQNGYSERTREPPTSQTLGKASNLIDEVGTENIQSDPRFRMQTEVLQVDLHEIVDDSLSFDSKRHRDPEVAVSRRHIPDFSHSSPLSRHSSIHSSQLNNVQGAMSINVDRKIVDRKDNLIVPDLSIPTMLNEHPDNSFNSSSKLVNDDEYSCLVPTNDNKLLLRRFGGEVASEGRDAADNTGESSIISNLLSLDIGSWDESLTSPQNLAKLLGEADKQQASFEVVPSSLKIQKSNQSRFSFAREEEPRSQASDFEPTIDYVDQAFKKLPFGHDFVNSNSFQLENFGAHNSFSVFNGLESDIFASSRPHLSSHKLSDNRFLSETVSRPQISAPPGFSVPSRAPPPGFTSHETEQINTLSANHGLDSSSLLRNQFQAHPGGNAVYNGDIEFIDPAILAVGKGMLPGGLNSPRSNYFSPQLTTQEDARLQSLLQRPYPLHPNQRFTDPRDGFSSVGDAYGIPSGVMVQTLGHNLSPFSQFTFPQSSNVLTSNGHWDGWNAVQGVNKLGMAELLRSERSGFNKYYSGYDDSKIRVPSSDNLYNGTFGI